jgi:raffinose synthase
MINSARNIGGSGGRVLRFECAVSVAEACFRISEPSAFECWMACRRSEACWMVPATGTRIEQIPAETQMLLFRNADQFTVYLPLVKEGFRASLFSEDGKLFVRVESGSPHVLAQQFDGVYVNEGSDPYALMHRAASDLCNELGSFSLPSRQSRPAFMNFFGWCSWNACYQEVSEEKIEQVLDTFSMQGLCPGFIIVDVGWQSSSKWHLTGLGCDAEKFPEGLGVAVQRIKSRFNVKHLFLWHTYNGFWCGLDPAAFPDARRADMESPARLLSGRRGESGEPFDTNSETFYPEHILDQEFRHPASFDAFYEEYHRMLSGAGADGVKIDAIAWIEACGRERGGRVGMMQEFLRGAEKSTGRYFNGEVIWCSCCSNDFILNSKGSGVVRTSRDFFPDRPETHGMHIYANALNSLFLGAFVHPDWDMFQTARGPASDFHAAARAISGGPVYSTDAFGEENFDLIKKLVLPDGTVPLCESHALPTLDSIFADPQQSLIKVFNRTKTARVLGIFNTAYEEDGEARRCGTYAVTDVVPLRSSTAEFSLYRNSDRSVRRVWAADVLEITLPSLGYELFTIHEIREGFSPVGDPGLFNSSGVIEDWSFQNGVHRVELRSCREFCAFSERSPLRVMLNGDLADFEWKDSIVDVALPNGFAGVIELVY